MRRTDQYPYKTRWGLLFWVTSLNLLLPLPPAHQPTIITTMSAFSRLFALALLFVALILAHNSTVVGRPLDGRHDSYGGPAGPSKGGDVVATNSTGACGPLGCSILNLDSHNAGNSGNSKSGDALNSPLSTSNSSNKKCMRRRGGAPSAYSGAAGDASGGGTTTSDGLIDIASDNAGNGGESESGNSENC
ncbi:hypothetical protein J3R30DRAFT_332818 [Lentinula aciculospora]|uniref:Uncharacterized protein n=1 Tax=Lentinula aciculospora TaxID=153920 RepID=A0A9W9A880_9AGAR|nr:hypothetical protein J3R30DRAFT_332818 [Lentinula aciculospora]